MGQICTGPLNPLRLTDYLLGKLNLPGPIIRGRLEYFSEFEIL